MAESLSQMLKKLLREKLYDVPLHDWVMFAAAVMFFMDILWLVWIILAKGWMTISVVSNSVSAIVGNIVTVGFLIFVAEWAAGRLQLRRYTVADALPIFVSLLVLGILYFAIPESSDVFGIPARFALIFGFLSFSPWLAPRGTDSGAPQ